MTPLLLTAAVAVSAWALYRLLCFATADADQSLLSKGNHRPNAFAGRVVWCTGASQGLGVALVKHFATHGAKLILSARNTAALEVCAA